ncbi:hypothetical protein B296_00036387 [Ensete ventricosum]|uniref:Uncharacterized protein n=1 Tax=Ensete ventricosum TaxID=4639 RepID=A0A426ZDU7_ENSVE|nr:hypothetical protein B296_00036387 [Ensete ventricosum]
MSRTNTVNSSGVDAIPTLRYTRCTNLDVTTHLLTQDNGRGRRTGAEEHKVHGGVDAGGGDDVGLGRSHGLLDPSQGVPRPRPPFQGIQTPQDAAGVVDDRVAGLPLQPRERKHKQREDDEGRPQGRHEGAKIHPLFFPFSSLPSSSSTTTTTTTVLTLPTASSSLPIFATAISCFDYAINEEKSWETWRNDCFHG